MAIITRSPESKTYHTMQKKRASAIVTGTALLLLVACSKPDLPAAPLGERPVLQQLADGYELVAEQLPVSPRKLPPAERRKFLETVFREAGFDYNATLTSAAAGALDPANQHHRDLVELLVLPTVGISQDDIAGFYSTEELAAIQAIEMTMR